MSLVLVGGVQLVFFSSNVLNLSDLFQCRRSFGRGLLVAHRLVPCRPFVSAFNRRFGRWLRDRFR